MKKLCLLLIMLAVCSLTACSKYALPTELSEAEVTAKSEQVIELLNAGEYQAVSDLFREDVRAQVSGEYLEDALSEMFAGLGAFKEIDGSATAGTTDKDTKERYGLIVVKADYENGDAQFTMYFDLDMNLIGLYMK